MTNNCSKVFAGDDTQNEKAEFTTSKDIVTEIKRLSDLQLLAKAKNLASEERRLTIQVLHHLMVIEDRRLYAKRGYQSLHEFVVSELQYSDGAAYRRIQSMRLMRNVPEVKEKIECGTLSLTNAAQLQRFMKEQRKKSPRSSASEGALQLIEKVENKSTRETERILMELAPAPITKDRERTLSANQTEIKFVGDQDLLRKIQDIKNLLAHTNPNPNYNELFHFMADYALQALKKKRGAEKLTRTADESKDAAPERTITSPERTTSAPKPSGNTVKSVSFLKPRHIPKQTRRSVWARDNGQCQYKDPVTGKACHSRFGLELDHRLPHALGGDNSQENLRLLCRAHNNFLAGQKFNYFGNDVSRRMHSPIF